MLDKTLHHRISERNLFYVVTITLTKGFSQAHLSKNCPSLEKWSTFTVYTSLSPMKFCLCSYFSSRFLFEKMFIGIERCREVDLFHLVCTFVGQATNGNVFAHFHLAFRMSGVQLFDDLGFCVMKCQTYEEYSFFFETFILQTQLIILNK